MGELRGENQPSVLKRKVGFQDQDQAPTETKEFDPREAQLMVIEQEDTWKELREGLRKAPIISYSRRDAAREEAHQRDQRREESEGSGGRCERVLGDVPESVGLSGLV